MDLKLIKTFDNYCIKQISVKIVWKWTIDNLKSLKDLRSWWVNN